MLTRINDWVLSWANSINPWTNVYGLARTLIALSTATTLLFNDASTFFRPTSDTTMYPICQNNSISIFCFVPNDYIYLDIIRWFCVILLFIVASGWRPRYTGVIHWWITFSFMSSATTLDGGEQVATVFTLLLIPITICDPRRTHWEHIKIPENKFIYRKIISLITIHIIRVQVAILYFHSVVAKLGEEEWINGTAVWYYIQTPMLGLPDFLTDIFMPLLSSSFIVIPTWGTLLMQTLLVCALFSPKKYWNYILVLALLMHELFAILLGLISFSVVMLGVLVIYLRPVEHEYKFKFNRVLNTLKHIIIKFNKGVKQESL